MKNKFFTLILILAGIGMYAWQTTGTASKAETTTSTTSTTNSGILPSQKSLPTTAQEVTYFENSKGFFAKPETPGTYPGIVMIHEWWGLNENIKDMAKQLAKEGYAVLAVDLYEGEVATTRERAEELKNKVTPEESTANLQGAVKYLRDNGAIKIASLGWCFGGGKSLELALSGEPLNATVIYYGQLVTDAEKLRAIKWPILGIFGDKDTSIPVDSVRAFESALNEVGIENEVYIYPGVGHAFANPSGSTYAPNETKDAWIKTLNFLNKHLNGQVNPNTGGAPSNL